MNLTRHSRNARRAWSLGALASVVWLATASCGGPGSSLCGAAADTSFSCGGYEAPSALVDACEERVTTACSASELDAYTAFLSCATDRCQNFSPHRRIAASCDHLLEGVSPRCFAAGVTGSSDYRYCAGGVDTCRSGSTCDPELGTCRAE